MREAASVCEDVLRQQGNHFDALHLLGVIHLQSGYTESGLNLVDKAIAERPGEAIAYISKGNGLQASGRPQAALEAFERALSLQPRSPIAHNNRGNALLALERAEEALASFERALELDPRYVSAHSNRGNALTTLKRAPEALVSLDRAIELDPRNTSALINRGIALLALERAEEALASHERALAVDPRSVEAWTNKGNALQDLRRPAEAVACYERALELRPEFYRARHNLCQALLALNRPAEALAAIEVVLANAPADPKALVNRGTALLSLGRNEEALEHQRSALAAAPDEPLLQGALAEAQMRCGRTDEAAITYEKLLSVSPEYEYALGSLCEVLLQRCHWKDLPKWQSAALAAVRAGKRAAPPFSLMALPSESADHLMCARAFLERAAPRALKPSSMPGYRHSRIRIAYVSPDFREHPVANQLVRLIETHDRSRFEVIAIALSKRDGSEVGERILAAFDRVVEASVLHESEIAPRIRDLEIDIAVDLSGHTFGARTGLFALRVAPVQVNYLGYPGTMASACHDYIIADPWVIPEQDEAHFSEAIVRLPHSYQPFDARPGATECTMTRAEAGLPADAFVFCCFNNRFKFNPDIFDVWMRILQRVPRSVLWLPECPKPVAESLRSEAGSRGVESGRVIFAPRLSARDAHLARYQLADLFLDTLPFNAHATATDALWAGLPLLTCLGHAFPGRVAAGMLNAVSLPELVTRDLREYEERAVSLAQPGSELPSLRERLISGRATHPLFDFARYRAALERAYERMAADADAGKKPSSFSVAG